MPNIKSAKKRVALSKAAYEKNKADKSALKTAVKKFEAAVASGNREQADSAYKAAVKSVEERNSSQEQRCPEKEQHDPEAQQAGLILLKISPSEFVQKEFFRF